MLSRASARAAALGSAKQGIGKLQVDSTALFVCDIQKVFAPLIHEFPSLVANTNTLINATRDMGMRPAVITEQVPRTFGSTVDEILSVAGSACPVIEKTDFSMVSESVIEAAGGAALRSVVLTGIEAHVCVQQTALDLMEQGIDVHVVVDAVSSQRQTDRDGALHVSGGGTISAPRRGDPAPSLRTLAAHGSKWGIPDHC